MSIIRKTTFSRRVVDHVTDELVSVLQDGESYEFKALFTKVFEGLKLRNAASGGEEMLRLRLYEKLLSLVKRGLIQKTGKIYCALKGLEEATSASRAARLELAMPTATTAC